MVFWVSAFSPLAVLVEPVVFRLSALMPLLLRTGIDWGLGARREGLALLKQD